MKRISVGGALLGAGHGGGTTFAPLVINYESQRFILLPSEKRIVGLAYRTGKPVATLQTEARICSVVKHGNIVLAGCHDGTVREFASEDFKTTTKQQVNAVVQPRRIYSIAKEKYSVAHLTAVASDTVSAAGRSDIGVILYALLVSNKVKKGSFSSSLVRVLVPSGNEETEDLHVDLQILDTFKFAPESTKSEKIPFSLSVVTTPQRSNSYYQNPAHVKSDSVFIVLASPISLTVYYDPLAKTLKLEKSRKYSDLLKAVSLDDMIPLKDPLSCLQISPNNTDIVCGHVSGMIRALNNVLSITQEYCLTLHGSPAAQARGRKDKSHPARQTLIRKVHWHAHPVASMTYDDCSSGSDAMLYSGGEESVLLTWQLARGIYRPSNKLPRIALGGILHILYISGQSSGPRGEPDSILVYCSDNSLQLFQSHNYKLIWKVQGLATSRERPAVLSPHIPTMVADRRKAASHDTIIISGLSGAPGHIHWYDPEKQCVMNSLEVVPFNRVSRTEASDTPMPSPTITHAAWSQSGSDLVTVDIVPTENWNIGSQLETDTDATYGAVSTIRFWSAVPGRKLKPYEVVAAMTYPHGNSNRVSAVALSEDGQYACTVSNDEKAFRLWRRGYHCRLGHRKRGKGKSFTESERSEWVCRCKVSTPSGYSNFGTGKSAVAFSADASVLAIAFGGTVTMWDHNEVTLLASLRHGDNDGAGEVHSVQFLDTNRLSDVLLIKSSTSVALRSPYGNRGPSGFGWNWTVPHYLEKNVRVSCAEFLPSDNLVAIALYSEGKKESRILLVDALSGKSCETLLDASPIIDNISGEVHSMASTGRSVRNRDWIGEKSTAICLYVLTDRGEMIAFDNTESKSEVSSSDAFVVDSTPEIPTLPLLSSSEDPATKKRKLSVFEISDLEESPATTLSLEHFGGIIEEGVVVPTAELPLLRGAFSRAFVSRHLQRREGE